MKKLISIKRYQGFSLVELMVGMAIGLFLLTGVFTVYINGRASQSVTDDQVAMMDDTRFAMRTLTVDLQQAGLWGRLNNFDSQSYALGDTDVVPLAAAVPDECETNWADYNEPVRAFNGNSPYAASCTAEYDAGTMVGLETDVLEVRYTLGQAIADADLRGDMVYVASDVNAGAVFTGTTPPEISSAAVDQNFPLVVNTYYIANWSNVAGDGIPSLHKVSLQPGPLVVDQMLLAGVENLQVQIGVDTDQDGAVNAYVEPDDALAAEWKNIRSVKIWLVVRSQKNDRAINTGISANIAGANWDFPNDGWRRQVFTSVISLRNAKNSAGI